MRDQIVALAREQLVEGGGEAISLRAISRGMGLASSAIHRYFATREALVEVLRERDASALVAAIQAADRAIQPRSDYSGRIRAMLGGLRIWALANPHSWLLLAGGASNAGASDDGTRSEASGDALVSQFLQLAIRPLGEARTAHTTIVPPRASLSVASDVIAAVDGLTDVVPRWQLATLVAAFAWACGAVGIELQHQLDGFVQDPQALFAAGADHWIAMLGL